MEKVTTHDYLGVFDPVMPKKGIYNGSNSIIRLTDVAKYLAQSPWRKDAVRWA